MVHYYGAGEVLHVGDSLEVDVAVNFRTSVNSSNGCVRSWDRSPPFVETEGVDPGMG